MNTEFLKGLLAEELFGVRLCESIEDQEIVDYLYEALLLEKFLWGEPISVPELRKLLRKAIVNFEFIKLDGKIRPSRGTTMMKYIPKEDHPKGIRPSSDAVATFFDMEKDAWRSVSKKSKEIVLKKDEEKNRPVVVVRDKDEELKKKGKDIEKLGPEPPDEMHIGDIRNYLNRNGKNVVVKITRMDDDGTIYAETAREGTPFKIPEDKVQNIGELTELPKEKPAPDVIVPPVTAPKPTAEVPEPDEMKPVTPETPEGEEGEIIELVPRPTAEPKEAPPAVDDEEDADELIK